MTRIFEVEMQIVASSIERRRSWWTRAIDAANDRRLRAF